MMLLQQLYCNGHCSYLSLRLSLHCPTFASSLPKSAKISHVGMHFHQKTLPQKPMKQAAMHTHTPAHHSAMPSYHPYLFFCNLFWGIFWEVATNVCDQQVLWKVTFEIPTRYSERTMLALKEKQLNSLTRNEIVQGISVKIFYRCKYPISSQVTPFVTKCFCFSPPHAV